MEKNNFIYLDPKGTPNDFAQCRSCKMFIKSHDICSLHGKDVKITGGMSCGLYCYGKADESELQHVTKAVTPEESGLVNREVRCENCEFFEEKDNDCLLFKVLNIQHKVNKHGCCNAQEPKDKETPVKKLKSLNPNEKLTIRKTKSPFE